MTDYRQRIIGSVQLDKHERTYNLVKKLSDIYLHFEKQIEKLELEKRESEDRCDMLKSKADVYDELATSIKESGKNAEKRLLDWHSRIAELHQLQLHSQREAQKKRKSSSF